MVQQQQLRFTRGTVRDHPRGGKQGRFKVNGVQTDGPVFKDADPRAAERKALRWIEEKKAALAREALQPPRGRDWMTYEEFARAWIERLHGVRPSTRRDANNKMVRSLDRFGPMRLDRIMEEDITDWLRSMEDEGLSPSYRLSVFMYFKRVMNRAMKKGYVPDDPFEEVRAPSAPLLPVDPLSMSQVEKLIACADDWFRIFVQIGAHTGLRQGEICGLEPGHVDLDRGFIRVRQQLLTPDVGPVCLGPPKAQASYRDMPIPDALAGPLEDHLRDGYRATCDGRVMLVALRPTRENPEPAPLDRGWVEKEFARTRDRAAVEATPHDLRHFYASLLCLQGADVPELKDALGHSPRSDEWQRYAHLMEGSKERTRDRLNRAWADRP